MKKLAFVWITAAVCAWSQSLDMSSLNKIEARAKEVNNVTLDANQIKAAMQLMPDENGKKDMDDAKKALSGLESVFVRNFEFDEKGQYSDSDLNAIRAQFAKLKGCSKIVDSKEKEEHSEVYMCSQDGKASGIAVIDAEPKELSVVYVKGSVNMKDLSRMHGAMGLPNIQIGPQPKTAHADKGDSE